MIRIIKTCKGRERLHMKTSRPKYHITVLHAKTGGFTTEYFNNEAEYADAYISLSERMSEDVILLKSNQRSALFKDQCYPEVCE